MSIKNAIEKPFLLKQPSMAFVKKKRNSPVLIGAEFTKFRLTEAYLMLIYCESLKMLQQHIDLNQIDQYLKPGLRRKSSKCKAVNLKGELIIFEYDTAVEGKNI
jgi:hypothetical protein